MSQSPTTKLFEDNIDEFVTKAVSEPYLRRKANLTHITSPISTCDAYLPPLANLSLKRQHLSIAVSSKRTVIKTVRSGGELVEIDTTTPHSFDYADLLQRVHATLRI